VAPQPVIPAQEKARLVLDLLAKRTTLSQAAQTIGVSPQAVANWRRRFITAGEDGLRPVARRTEDARRERQLLGEIALLKAALGEAHLALRGHRIRDLGHRSALPRAAHARTPDA